MNVNGEYRLPASREKVWEALRDPETLRACIPGCEAMTRAESDAYEGRLTTQVGAVTTTFAGRVTLAEEDFPRGWSLSAHLQSPTAGFADGDATVTLTAEGSFTVLGYRARVEPGGRMASVGNRLLHGVAIRMANEFFTRLIERLAPPAAGAAPQELAEPVPVPIPPKVVHPIAPTSAPSPGPKATPVGNPPPESQSVPGLPYQGDVDPRTQNIVIAAGWVAFVMILLLMFWPRP
ncbi:MAG: carbon monoxide dehydrogenase subunit G [Pseudomonadota bacterium]